MSLVNGSLAGYQNGCGMYANADLSAASSSLPLPSSVTTSMLAAPVSSGDVTRGSTGVDVQVTYNNKGQIMSIVEQPGPISAFTMYRFKTLDQGVNSGVDTPITFESFPVGFSGGPWFTTINDSVYSCAIAGNYRITAHVGLFNDTSGGQLRLELFVNGALAGRSTVVGSTLSLTTELVQFVQLTPGQSWSISLNHAGPGPVVALGINGAYRASYVMVEKIY